jgi:hypothetical protein
MKETCEYDDDDENDNDDNDDGDEYCDNDDWTDNEMIIIVNYLLIIHLQSSEVTTC